MKYLRTSEEILKFCNECKIETVSVFCISKYIETNFDLSFLGYFHSILDDSFWAYKHSGGDKTQVNKFAATSNVLDFLVNSKLLSDSTSDMSEGRPYGSIGDYNDKIVKLFGKMESGRITEIIVFNTGNYFETSFTERAKAKSKDLWF